MLQFVLFFLFLFIYYFFLIEQSITLLLDAAVVSVLRACSWYRYEYMTWSQSFQYHLHDVHGLSTSI